MLLLSHDVYTSDTGMKHLWAFGDCYESVLRCNEEYVLGARTMIHINNMCANGNWHIWNQMHARKG